MKKVYLKLLLSSIVLLSVSSCRDELTVSPNDRILLENAFNTEADFRKGIDNAYDGFKMAGYYSGDNSQNIVPDIISDNLILNPLGRRSNQQVYILDFAANVSGVTSVYGAAFNVISRSNAVLKYIDRLPSGASRNNIEAEARAIRAIAHFDIARRYCKIPTQSADAGASMGIAYVDKYDPFIVTSRDLTVNQVYDKILEDLLFAEANITQSANVGKLTKAAIQGMLSRVYLYKGDYANTIVWGEKSLALNSNLGTLESFSKIWDDSSNDGVLFKILNSSVENIKTGSCYNQTVSGQIKSEYVVDYGFYNLFNDTDVRKAAYIKTSVFSGKNFNNVIKHKQALNKPVEAVDVKYLRTAEVLLNVAEAKYKTGAEVEALSLLNKLRAQRYSGFVNGTESGTSLWNAIMLERRLELAFETDRFFTLKRLGMPIQRTSAGAYSDGTGEVPTTLSLDVASHKWQLPIPQNAIDVNPGTKQNPGY